MVRQGIVIHAHRFSYERYKTAIPRGLFVLHRCDVPSCVNPSHLFVGAAKDNVRDCIKKGRNSLPPKAYGKNNALSKNLENRLGENHHSAKLTETDVKNILASSFGPSKLARQYGVRRQIIWMIRKGLIWKRVHR
jgi:hypothetical protein